MKKILVICFFIFSCDTQIQGVILEDHNYTKLIHAIYNHYSSNKYDLFYKFLDDDVIAYYSSESIVGADELIETLTFDHYYFSNIKIEKVLSSPVCRCWETAKYAGWKYKIDKRLTSNIKNKAKVEKLATKYKGDGNLLLITHMNLIKKLYPWFKVDSGEIVVVDKDLNFIGSIEIPYEFTY